MPVYRYSAAPGHLEKAIADLERTDQIVSVVAGEDGMVLVFTVKPQRAAGGKETRG